MEEWCLIEMGRVEKGAPEKERNRREHNEAISSQEKLIPGGCNFVSSSCKLIVGGGYLKPKERE